MDIQDMIGKMFDEFPDESEWDVVIIGGGPNGLMAGAYLAKAGLKVAVVERRDEIGGGLATDEILFPCYWSNPHVIYHMMVDYMPVIQDFGLGYDSFNWIKPNDQASMIFDGGKSIALARMVEDSRDSIRKFSYKDAENYGKALRSWEKIADELIAPMTYFPPMAPIDVTVAMQRTSVGQELLELQEKCVLDIINETFENDQVRAMMLYICCMWGLDPRETGVGLFVPLYLIRGINKCYCYGGSHKFASAMGREIVKGGGLLLEAAAASKILMENGRVAGVQVAEGRTLRSKVVISSLDPHSTFLDLLGAEHISEPLKKSVEGWKYDKWSFNTLHIVTNEPPKYACDDPFVDQSFFTVFGVNSTDELLAHWDNVVAGKIGDTFCGHATCESNFDPFLSRKKGHYVSFFQMHAPYDLEGGWDNKAPEIENAILEKWQKAAPNIKKENIIRTSMETPVDIEIRFPNMRRGAIKHGDYFPMQLACFRPNQECSDTRTPIEGLYVCGASTYPGGMVIGGGGYLAANKVVEDLGANKWWKPTKAMEKFQKTYLD